MWMKTTELLEKAGKLIIEGSENGLIEAERMLNTVAEKEPNSIICLYLYGSLAKRKGQIALAIQIYERVIAIKPDFADGWNNLGCIYREHNNLIKARECFDKAIALTKEDKDKAVYQGNKVATLIADGKSKQMIEEIEPVLNALPQDATAIYNRSLAYLEQGQWEQGFKDYDYRKMSPDVAAATGLTAAMARNYSEHPDQPYPAWEGKPNQGVLIYGEQGIGDEILFASVIPELCAISRKVIFDAHPRLMNIFRESFKDIPNLVIYGTRKDKELSWPQYHHKEIDAQIPIGSVVKFFRKKDSDFPRRAYIRPNMFLAKHYEEKLNRLGNRPRIGVSWRGGVIRNNSEHRRIDLVALMTLLSQYDADFISLQYNDDAFREVETLWEEHHLRLHHWPTAIENYDHTTALVSQLNCVISVPQSVVHLAGALGILTMQLCPKRAMWQQGVYGQDLIWYPTVKNLWQQEFDNWTPVMTQLKAILDPSFNAIKGSAQC